MAVFYSHFLHVTKMAASKQLWDTTREPNLLRNTASGRYYGRFTLSGKQKWVNLETDVWTVAKIRLADERAKIERLRQTADDVTAGDASMGALVALYRQRVDDRVDIRPDTRRRLSRPRRARRRCAGRSWTGLQDR